MRQYQLPRHPTKLPKHKQWLRRLICKTRGHDWKQLGAWGNGATVRYLDECSRCGAGSAADEYEGIYSEWSPEYFARVKHSLLKGLF